MKIGLIGDMHGNQRAMVRDAIPTLVAEGASVLYQLGDFGVWNSTRGAEYADAVQDALNDADIKMVVTEGNHEDYDVIKSLPINEEGFKVFRPNILLAPRAHRWEVGGRTVVSLGGAASVDRKYRLQVQRIQKIKLWWAEEAILPSEVQKTIDDGYADIMLAHDAPNSVRTINNAIASNPFGFAREDLSYADINRQYMTQAFDGVKPMLFVHGHYHMVVDEEVHHPDDTSTRVIGLDMEERPGALAMLDTETMSVTTVIHTERGQ